MNEQLIKRLKSFGWRVSMVVVAASIDAILANLAVLELPDLYTIIIGLVLGEVSKWLNKK